MEDDGAVSFRVQQIDHIELFVLDRYAAAKWYERVLGFEIITEHEHWADDPKGPLMLGCGDEADVKLALFEGRPQEGRETSGFHRVAFRVDAAGFLEFLDRLGSLDLVDHEGNAVDADQVADHGSARSIYFCDPHGHRLELTTYDVDALVLLQSGVTTEAADVPEVELLEPDPEPTTLAEMATATDQEVPWMCHLCSFRLPASDGFVCSICYRSTCPHCVVRSAAQEAPICKACVEEQVG